MDKPNKQRRKMKAKHQIIISFLVLCFIQKLQSNEVKNKRKNETKIICFNLSFSFLFNQQK